MTRLALIGASALFTNAPWAAAQLVTFSTGIALPDLFGGGPTLCSGGFCHGANGLLLASAGTGRVESYVAPSIVDLGVFSVFAPSVPYALTDVVGVRANLFIFQYAPSAGEGILSGALTGALAYNPSSSTLAWTPSATTLTLGIVTYHLITDVGGSIAIQAATTADAASGQPNLTSVKGYITVVTPEPATLLLLVPGLAGLALVFRRRLRLAGRG